MPKKKQMGVFSATGCRICDQAILDIQYQVSALDRWADIVFWPYVLGSSAAEADRIPDLDVCFFAGAIATADDRDAALALREKSDILVACGSCAAYGGMPGLANLAQSDAGAEPMPASQDTPDLPPKEPRVSALSQLVAVDYTLPGCAPRQNYLWAAIQSIVIEAETALRIAFSACRLPEAMARAVTAGIRPPKGSVFSGSRAVCASCSRVKEKKQFTNYARSGPPDPDSERCLLEQGMICQGIVTREGCGGACTAAGRPCRGCFGKTEAILDPGAKMVAAISSTFDAEDPEEIAAMADRFVDLAGTFYRYTLANQCVLGP